MTRFATEMPPKQHVAKLNGDLGFRFRVFVTRQPEVLSVLYAFRTVTYSSRYARPA